MMDRQIPSRAPLDYYCAMHDFWPLSIDIFNPPMRVGGLTRVQAPLGVELGVTGKLCVADSKDLDPDQLGDAEGKGESGPGGAVQLDLASINPGGRGRDCVLLIFQ